MLQHAKVEMKKYLHYEDEFWRQETGIRWFSEGDKNTEFFHNLVIRRWKKLQIKRIQNSKGEWLEGDQLAVEAIHCYQKQFSQKVNYVAAPVLRYIRDMVT